MSVITKAKPNQTVQCFTSGTHPRSSGLQKAYLAKVASLALPSAAHTAYLRGSGQLHYTLAICGSCPWYWLLLDVWSPLQPGSAFSWAFFRDSGCATEYQASTSLHDYFNPRACTATEAILSLFSLQRLQLGLRVPRPSCSP